MVRPDRNSNGRKRLPYCTMEKKILSPTGLLYLKTAQRNLRRRQKALNVCSRLAQKFIMADDDA
jgi:hypothetical protein